MTSSELHRQLYWLRESIPSAKRRRTARGLMRTVRELAEHRKRTAALHVHAQTDAEHRAIDDLVAEIEHQRTKLNDDAALVEKTQAERAGRSLQKQILHGELKRADEKTPNRSEP